MANGLKARFEDLSASFARMSERERLMVGGLAAAVLVLVVFGLGYWIVSGLDELEENNAEMRQALRDIESFREPFLKQRRRTTALKVRMGHGALELNSYVEKAASAVGVSIAESSDVAPIKGPLFTRRGLEIKLRKVTISQLASLVKRLEEEQAHIVQVTELSVNTRWNRNQELDVEMVVSTYEEKEKKDQGGKPKRGRGSRS